MCYDQLLAFQAFIDQYSSGEQRKSPTRARLKSSCPQRLDELYLEVLMHKIATIFFLFIHLMVSAAPL